MIKFIFTLFTLLGKISLSVAQTLSVTGELLVFEGSKASNRVWVKTSQTNNKSFIPIVPPPGDEFVFTTGMYIDANYEDGSFPYQITTYNIAMPDKKIDTVISSITYIVNICDSVNTLTTDVVKRKWSSFANHVRTCSWGVNTFPRDKNIVLGPFNVSCDAFNTNTCDESALYDLIYTLDTKAQNAPYKLNPFDFKRRILLLPLIPSCQWTGMGTIGCGNSCMIWLNGEISALSTSTLFHEFGHTQGLLHSASGSDEYGDFTCPMGQARSEYACLNPVHNLKLGWSRIARDITSPVDFMDIRLDCISCSRNNVIRFNPSINNGELLYITFIKDFRYSALQDESVKNKLIFHVANTGSSAKVKHLPFLINVMGVGESFTYFNANVTFVSINGTTALIRLYGGGSQCGDFTCTETANENVETCPFDCCQKNVACGDGICDSWAGENCLTCPDDCKASGVACCGDGNTGCPEEVCGTSCAVKCSA